MISLHVSGKNFDIDGRTGEYLNDKIGGLDRYFPKRVQESHGNVILEHTPSAREDDQYSCEVTVHVPKADFQSKETALTMTAAIDQVEANLKAQIAKYKDRFDPQRPNAREQLVDLSREAELSGEE